MDVEDLFIENSPSKAFGRCDGVIVLQLDFVRPFTGELVQDDDELVKDIGKVTKQTKSELDDCMAIARRLRRSLNGNGAKKSPVTSISVKAQTDVKTEMVQG